MTRFALTILLGATLGCSETTDMVPLLSAAGVPITDPTDVPLRVVTRSTAVQEPLRLRGTSVVYGDIETTLGHAIASAAAPWAKSHDSGKNKEGWELFVEVTNADASYADERVVFSLGVRATLRQRSGNDYLAQTQASCRQGGIVPPRKGAPIMFGCMMEVGRTLAGWLDGVDLDAISRD